MPGCGAGRDGHGDTTEAIRAKLDAFIGYKRVERAARKAELAELTGFMNTLQTSCRNNDRPVYTAPEEISPPALEELWLVGPLGQGRAGQAAAVGGGMRLVLMVWSTLAGGDRLALIRPPF
jgi:hypothetical protein